MYDVKKKSLVQRFREWLDPIPEPSREIILGGRNVGMEVYVNGYKLSGVQKVSMNVKLTPLEALVEPDIDREWFPIPENLTLPTSCTYPTQGFNIL